MAAVVVNLVHLVTFAEIAILVASIMRAAFNVQKL